MGRLHFLTVGSKSQFLFFPSSLTGQSLFAPVLYLTLYNTIGIFCWKSSGLLFTIKEVKAAKTKQMVETKRSLLENLSLHVYPSLKQK